MERHATQDTIDEHADTQDLLVPRLSMISKSTRALLGLKLADADLVIGQDQALIALAQSGGRHLTEVADELLVRPSTISKMIDPLERAGICRRNRSKDDMRKIMLVLTPKGRKLADEARAISAELDRELVACVPEDRLAALNEDLGRVSLALKARLSRLR